MHKLISIRFSHYNEKARWALDRFGIGYEEDGYMPVMHMPVVWKHVRGSRKNRGDRVSTPYSTPVLITDEGQHICDSSEIVRYVSDRYSTAETNLYPTEEVTELERFYHDKLGAHSRRVGYFYALPDSALMRRLAERNVSSRQAKWFMRLFPWVKGFMVKGLGITEPRMKSSLEKARRIFDDVAEQLSDGRPYLLGERFTAADISMACMGSLAVMVTYDEGYGAYLPALDECPPEAIEMLRGFREHPTGEYILRMFREERGKRQIPYGSVKSLESE